MSFHNHDEDIINRMRKQFEIDKKNKKGNITNDGPRGGAKWRRYRFETRSVEDSRPIVFNPKYPWWCSGYKADLSSATIIAYLPIDEDLKTYWDDAFNIEHTDHATIEFSDRFPKPKYFVE